MMRVKTDYITGLQWVLHYYYQGVTSWSWFFPYHYAPMMSDLVDLESLNLEYSMGKPFRPFEQLLAVLPPASMKHLPSAFHVFSPHFLSASCLFFFFVSSPFFFKNRT